MYIFISSVHISICMHFYSLNSTKATCVLYSSSYRPLSPPPPLHSPLAIVTLFLISMSLVIFTHKYKIKGEGRGGEGRWDWLGWGGGMGRKCRKL